MWMWVPVRFHSSVVCWGCASHARVVRSTTTSMVSRSQPCRSSATQHSALDLPLRPRSFRLLPPPRIATVLAPPYAGTVAPDALATPGRAKQAQAPAGKKRSRLPTKAMLPIPACSFAATRDSPLLPALEDVYTAHGTAASARMRSPRASQNEHANSPGLAC